MINGEKMSRYPEKAMCKSDKLESRKSSHSGRAYMQFLKTKPDETHTMTASY